jgi:hypothetical protein
MNQLLTKGELIVILERGLLNGYWSINEFNATAPIPIYPTASFLHANPQFTVINFRDIDAYFQSSQHNRERGVL